MCVQRFDDSLSCAIRITYRISQRSSSIHEPRDPPLKVVSYIFYIIENINFDMEYEKVRFFSRSTKPFVPPKNHQPTTTQWSEVVVVVVHGGMRVVQQQFTPLNHKTHLSNNEMGFFLIVLEFFFLFLSRVFLYTCFVVNEYDGASTRRERLQKEKKLFFLVSLRVSNYIDWSKSIKKTEAP